MKQWMKRLAGVLLVLCLFTACESAGIQTDNQAETKVSETSFSLESLPEYSGKPYVELNQNVPSFTKEEITDKSFESYGEFDSLGRCTAAFACLSVDTMPAEGEERGKIGNVRPSGWQSVRYDCVEGNYIYNRAHLIGWQLGAENDNEKNLVTGTRYMNIEMLVYENQVAEYIKSTGNHVMYRVTPVFQGDELLCRGLEMEGYSVEDSGKGVEFHVFFYNVQPGISIDYATGESSYNGIFLDKTSKAVRYEGGDETEQETETAGKTEGDEMVYVLNRNTMKFHKPECDSAEDIKEENREEFKGDREYLIQAGYTPCKKCNP